MFPPEPGPRVFALPPGADFAAELARGLRDRLAGQPPEAMARVRLLVPTVRLRAAVQDAFALSGPGYLPRIDTLPGLAGDDETPPLARLLELMRLIRGLLAAEPGLGPPGAALGLARSLEALIEEMADESVPAAALRGLDVGDHAIHWQLSLKFLGIIGPWIEAGGGSAQRLRAVVTGLLDRWQDHPPAGPLIIAGSTGSRGTTAALMQAVAGLPQGAVVLPGYDPDMPEDAWQRLDDLRRAEDHPQARFRLFLQRLDLPKVKPWTEAAPPDPARNRLISLALRPAPVTDQWLAEGPKLGDPGAALQRLSLIEAPGPRAEALAIARALAEAVAEGRSAALVTPDRLLARRVTVALDRWRLRPDDSAGRPLGLSAPGRFLRQLAALVAGDGQIAAAPLIALLKHPLSNSGAGRGPHLLALRDFELWLRDRGQPFPGPADLPDFAARRPAHADWAAWLAGWLGSVPPLDTPLPEGLAAFRALAEALAGGAEGGRGALWDKEAGQRAQARLEALTDSAAEAPDLTLSELPALLDAAMAGQELRETDITDPRVMIWGPQEVRARSADLVILGGLTEGVWPAMPAPDPWLNRALRLEAGLRLPERQIGLSAHDFQIAAAAPQVVLSHAARSTDAETVPARWLNRLVYLTVGLPGGPEALRQARARGRAWLDRALAEAGDLSSVPPEIATRNPRPAPAPPAGARPKLLRVTELQRLIRDPYALYARRVLELEPLQPLAPQPDARLRGILLHALIEDVVRAHPPGQPLDAARFLKLARVRLERDLPWQAERIVWLSRLARIAPGFLDWHAGLEGEPVLVEQTGRLELPGPDHPLVTLIGKPDRIDRLPDGRLALYDYKTGRLPSKAVQEAFDKQLILLAIMADSGAFKGLEPAEVALAEYIGLGTKFDRSPAPVDGETLTETCARLLDLIGHYADPDQGYPARRALQRESDRSDYDALSRLGEWQLTDRAVVLKVGEHDG